MEKYKDRGSIFFLRAFVETLFIEMKPRTETLFIEMKPCADVLK